MIGKSRLFCTKYVILRFFKHIFNITIKFGKRLPPGNSSISEINHPIFKN
jgi:hypothetical protein